MKTKYTDKIHFFINEDLPEDAFMYWVEKQTLIDQPDIMREFKNILKVGFANKGIYDFDFEEIDQQIEVYEEAILSEKLAEAELVMAQEALDKKILEVIEVTAQVRQYVIGCIINNEDNAKAMHELALKLIEGEKENDVYDANNWAAIL